MARVLTDNVYESNGVIRVVDTEVMLNKNFTGSAIRYLLACVYSSVFRMCRATAGHAGRVPAVYSPISLKGRLGWRYSLACVGLI
ncbi:MAG: hypothetical protein J7502_11535 [Flavisolibacter sp.]|nr:hypothetical protein [Flavisolibacter sp.]